VHATPCQLIKKTHTSFFWIYNFLSHFHNTPITFWLNCFLYAGTLLHGLLKLVKRLGHDYKTWWRMAKDHGLCNWLSTTSCPIRCFVDQFQMLESSDYTYKEQSLLQIEHKILHTVQQAVLQLIIHNFLPNKMFHWPISDAWKFWLHVQGAISFANWTQESAHYSAPIGTQIRICGYSNCGYFHMWFVQVQISAQIAATFTMQNLVLCYLYKWHLFGERKRG